MKRYCISYSQNGDTIRGHFQCNADNLKDATNQLRQEEGKCVITSVYSEPIEDLPDK